MESIMSSQRYVISRLYTVIVFLLLPSIASAFFCNQSNVTVSWGKHNPFKVDGDGFSRGNFQVIDPGDQSMIQFDKMEITDALEAEFQITGLKPGTTEIAVRWEFTDKSDNGICNATVEVTDLIYPYQTARNDILNYINTLGLSPDDGWAFMPYRPLCPGTLIQSADKEDVNITLDSDAWFAYIDFSKDLRYGRYGQYVFIDGESGEMTTHEVEWYPLIDNEPYLFDVDEVETIDDKIFGSQPIPTNENDASTVSDPVVNTTPKEDVCAVLVSGTAEKQRQIESFEQDVDFIKKNLMNESLGPQLTEGDISVLNNASFQEIKDKLASFKGRYRKVYFYYSGHGTERYMVTNDTVGNRMWYVDLARALEETEADDICVILDACHSGGAIESFKNNEGLQSTNVTLLTSSRADTTSWTRYIVTGGGDTVRTGEYTWAFVKCFGDPNADRDNDGKVTIKEAHRWALDRNPELDVGGTLRGRMDPQCWLHRAPETTEQVIRPADTRLTIDQGVDERLPSGSELRIDVHFDTDDTATDGDDVFYISPKLQWDMRLVPDDPGYRIGIQFDYSFAKEDFTGQGEPGVVWRSDENEKWSVYRPTIPNLDSNYVLADELTKLGQFAIAEVEKISQSVVSQASWNGYLLHQNHPNPVSNTTFINYTLPNPATVSLSIVDPLGRSIYTHSEGLKASGSHQLRWNARDEKGDQLPPGTYLIRLEVRTSTGESLGLVQKMVLIQ